MINMDTESPSQAALPQFYDNNYTKEASISTGACAARCSALSSLRLDSSNLYQSNPEESSPFSSYILALQEELLSTPTLTFPVQTYLASRDLGRSDLYDPLSILASPPSAPENLSYNDGVNCAVNVNSPAAESIQTETSGNICCTPVKERELSLAESDEMREALEEEITNFEGHKTNPLRQSSPSSSLLADENYCRSSKVENSANSRLKRKTPEVCMDDLGKLRVGEADRKCQRPKSRKTISHENRQPRYTIETVSEREIIDDGYRWRKYGRKTVKQSPHHRNYYKCSNPTCKVKKRVERSPKDSSIVLTTYEGTHTHPSPLIIYEDIVQHDTSPGSNCGTSKSKNLQPRSSYDLFVQMEKF